MQVFRWFVYLFTLAFFLVGAGVCFERGYSGVGFALAVVAFIVSFGKPKRPDGGNPKTSA